MYSFSTTEGRSGSSRNAGSGIEEAPEENVLEAEAAEKRTGRESTGDRGSEKEALEEKYRKQKQRKSGTGRESTESKSHSGKRLLQKWRIGKMESKQKIDGYTRTCGLIGNPVEHTMSPVIHNTLSERLGENLVYVPFHVPTGQVKEAVEGAFALNLLGCNVTVPYKSEVIPYLKELDGLAERIGAVNTLVRREDGFKGYNTDMPGLYRAMCEDGVKIAGEKVLVLGAGGVARAVVMLLAEKNAEQIIILNRSREKAQKIADEVNGYRKETRVSALSLGEYNTLPETERYLAIQATNVGMFPNTEEAVFTEADFYRRVHTGYDLIFNPSETLFMKKVRENGGKAYNGLKMLLYQGVIAYELWTGKEISGELSAEVYQRMQEAMRKHEEGANEK